MDALDFASSRLKLEALGDKDGVLLHEDSEGEDPASEALHPKETTDPDSGTGAEPTPSCSQEAGAGALSVIYTASSGAHPPPHRIRCESWNWALQPNLPLHPFWWW